MNYELRNIDNIEFLLANKPRSIKLRQLSYTNVLNNWSFDVSSIAENVVDNYIPDTEVANEEIVKLPVLVGNLEDQILLIDSSWGTFQSIKRRLLAVSSEMYQNINNSVAKVFGGNIADSTVVSNEINDDEIKQAVKDAFDQIDFNVSNNTDDVVITPEEVNDTVSDVNNEVDFSYGSDDVEIPNIDNFESDDKENNDDKSVFNFEDVNFDKIESNEVEIDKQDAVVDNEFDQNTLDDSDSDDLDNILSEIRELKAQKDEQDKKTEDAINLAHKKEEEKEKAKIDFANYKSTIKEELDRSKKEEEENLAKAKKAEEFTAALSDIMNNGSTISNSFITEN